MDWIDGEKYCYACPEEGICLGVAGDEAYSWIIGYELLRVNVFSKDTFETMLDAKLDCERVYKEMINGSCK